MKLVFDFKHKNLPDDLSNLFRFNSEINSYFTRNVSNEGLYIPKIKTKNFGTNSLKYSAPIIWNSFLKTENSINSFKNAYSLSKFLKKYFLTIYGEVS